MKSASLCLLAVLGALAGCLDPGSSDSQPDPDHVKPTLFGQDFMLLGGQELMVLDWTDESSGDCTLLRPCHTDRFVIDEVTCDGCTVEVANASSGAIVWEPAQGISTRGSVDLRVTALTVGDKTLRVVLRSTEHGSVEYVETVTLAFTVDRVVSIAGACQTGAHQEQDFQIKVTPCSAARVVGDSLYVQPTLLTQRGRLVTSSRYTGGIQLTPPPTRRVSVQLMVNTLGVDLGEYQNPAANLREVTLTGTFANQGLTAKVALPPGA